MLKNASPLSEEDFHGCSGGAFNGKRYKMIVVREVVDKGQQRWSRAAFNGKR